MERRQFLQRTGVATAWLCLGARARGSVRTDHVLGKIMPADVGLRIAGDIVDSKGQKTNYEVMLRFLEKLKMPVLFALGNHETRYGAKITPGDRSELANYFDAQKQINGLDKLVYSFDLGRWHFVVWPDPLRRGFREAHPHFFDRLDEDLRLHGQRPTIFIQHISLLPIGLDPMIVYAETVPVKRRLLDILTRYGNVKYVFSGHTHIPLRASLKIARTYRGATFINLPPAGYRARGFGEPDFGQGPSQGFALVKIRGQDAVIHLPGERHGHARRLEIAVPVLPTPRRPGSRPGPHAAVDQSCVPGRGAPGRCPSRVAPGLPNRRPVFSPGR